MFECTRGSLFEGLVIPHGEVPHTASRRVPEVPAGAHHLSHEGEGRRPCLGAAAEGADASIGNVHKHYRRSRGCHGKNTTFHASTCILIMSLYLCKHARHMQITDIEL